MSFRSILGTRLPEWQKANKRLRTTALIFVGLVCLNLLGYAFLLTPSKEKLRDLEGKYADLRKQHTEALLFQKQKQLFAGFRSGIPTQKDMPLLVKELVQKARQWNLSVAGISYDIPRRGNNEITMLTFLLPIEGHYADVKRFIHEIESSDRLVGIQDLKFDSDKGRVKLQMKLVTYIKGE